MAKLSSERRFGGVVLVLIGLGFIFLGIFTMFFSSNIIFDIISIFFANVPSIVLVMGIFSIIFGLFLVWAGRTIRNEPFIPDALRGK